MAIISNMVSSASDDVGAVLLDLHPLENRATMEAVFNYSSNQTFKLELVQCRLLVIL